jgi:topoisomerase-4 subunit B
MKICNRGHGLSYHSSKGDDIEVAMTHSKSQYSEEYHFCKWTKHHSRSTHLVAFREAVVKTIREFYNKTLSLRIFVNPLWLVSIKVMEPVLNLKQNIRFH